MASWTGYFQGYMLLRRVALVVYEMEKWTRVYGRMFLSLYDYLTRTRASQQAKRSEVGE